MKRIYLCLLILLVGASGAWAASPFVTLDQETKQHQATGFIFKNSIDNFAAIQSIEYDDSGRHYSVNYKDRESQALISIYVFPVQLLEGLQNADMVAIQRNEEFAIFHTYPNAKAISEAQFTYGNIRGLRTLYNLGNSFTELYMAKGKTYVVKFRISYKAENAEFTRQYIDSFLNQWAALNSGVKF